MVFQGDAGELAHQGFKALQRAAAHGQGLFCSGQGITGAALADFDQQVSLGLKVVVNKGLGRAQPLGKLVDGRLQIPALVEQLACLIEDAVAFEVHHIVAQRLHGRWQLGLGRRTACGFVAGACCHDELVLIFHFVFVLTTVAQL